MEYVCYWFNTVEFVTKNLSWSLRFSNYAPNECETAYSFWLGASADPE